MMDSYGRKYAQPVIELGAKGLNKMGLSANAVTWIAMLLGVTSGIVLLSGHVGAAVIMLWLSGYLDTVDGTIARMTHPSVWGNIMDITFDRIVEGAMVIALVEQHNYGTKSGKGIFSYEGISVVEKLAARDNYLIQLLKIKAKRP